MINPGLIAKVASHTSANVEIEEPLAPQTPTVDPAPSFPFDPQALIPHLKLNLDAMQSPALLTNLLRTNSFVNPGHLPFTEQEAEKLIDGAQLEIALTRQQAVEEVLRDRNRCVARSSKAREPVRQPEGSLGTEDFCGVGKARLDVGGSARE